MDLMQLTGYESGVCIFDNEGFVSNWASIDGIPRIFMGMFQLGMGDGDDLEPTEVTEDELEFARQLIEDDSDCECDDTEDKVAGAWRNDDVLIITFEGWN